MNRTLILGSSSPYRKELITRFQIDFHTYSPEIDETRLVNETPKAMIRRLSLQKAKAIANATGLSHPNALIIASDQCAILGDIVHGKVLGKPGNYDNAVQQLQQSSGQCVSFLTGLCLYDKQNKSYQLDVIPFAVQFRTLNLQEIASYLEKDQPYNSAGSFKSEGLGITLFKKMIGDDPTALIGLPLIRLSEMLRAVSYII